MAGQKNKDGTTPTLKNPLLASNPKALKDFLAIDLRSQFFPDNGANDLADVYRRVFNDVKDVSAKWTPRSADSMIDLHGRTLGCNLALLDLTTEKIIGGYLSTIVPSAEGWRLSSQDLFISSKYQGRKIGSSLYYQALVYADDLCQRELGSTIASISGTTYKIPDFPKGMWERKGYQLHPLYSLAAKEILRPENGNDLGIIIEHAHTNDANKIVSFISGNEVVSSDKEKWSEAAASSYVNFMLENHPATFVVTKKENEIVAVSSINLLPGRSGPYGIETQCFVANTSISDQKDIVGASLKHLLICANGASMQLFGENISAIEVPESSAPFFQKRFYNLREDTEFLGITGYPADLKRNLCQSNDCPQVTLVECHRSNRLRAIDQNRTFGC